MADGDNERAAANRARWPGKQLKRHTRPAGSIRRDARSLRTGTTSLNREGNSFVTLQQDRGSQDPKLPGQENAHTGCAHRRLSWSDRRNTFRYVTPRQVRKSKKWPPRQKYASHRPLSWSDRRNTFRYVTPRQVRMGKRPRQGVALTAPLSWSDRRNTFRYVTPRPGIAPAACLGVRPDDDEADPPVPMTLKCPEKAPRARRGARRSAIGPFIRSTTRPMTAASRPFSSAGEVTPKHSASSTSVQPSATVRPPVEEQRDDSPRRAPPPRRVGRLSVPPRLICTFLNKSGRCPSQHDRGNQRPEPLRRKNGHIVCTHAHFRGLIAGTRSGT